MVIANWEKYGWLELSTWQVDPPSKNMETNGSKCQDKTILHRPDLSGKPEAQKQKDKRIKGEDIP